MHSDDVPGVSVDDELAALSEFALLRENARSIGLTGALPPVGRVSVTTADGEVSALRWGADTPRLVFLHGGGQNAHTWDSAILATGLPAVSGDSRRPHDPHHRPVRSQHNGRTQPSGYHHGRTGQVPPRPHQAISLNKITIFWRWTA
ncbi:hypothetical protein ABZ413_25545 [Nocardia rhamnosiphila]|uniref:alpha/beta fold hydrolase n=1 Tax=Nocardia rhamnosiphila TaxID=426716 RepID=UPI0033DED0B4